MAEPRERDRDATKARLIRAVEELIALDGFGVVGINAVARRAGADKVLIYRYFGGLAALLAAYAEEGDFWWRVDDLLAEPLPGRADEEGLPACLATVFARHAAFLRDHPVTLEVIAWEMSERNELTQGLESVRESRSQARRPLRHRGRRLPSRGRPDVRAVGRGGQLPRRPGASARHLQRH